MSIHKGESSWQLNNNTSSVHCLLKGKRNFPSYPYLNCAYETRNILSAFIFSCTQHNLIKVKESKSITWCGELSFTALLSSQFCSCLDSLFLRSFLLESGWPFPSRWEMSHTVWWGDSSLLGVATFTHMGCFNNKKKEYISFQAFSLEWDSFLKTHLAVIPFTLSPKLSGGLRTIRTRQALWLCPLTCGLTCQVHPFCMWKVDAWSSTPFHREQVC